MPTAITARLQDANKSALQNLYACAPHLARHDLVVIGFCTMIAVVL